MPGPLLRAAAAAALALPSPAALACSLCACGDPLVAATDQASAGELRVGFETEWLTARSGMDPTRPDMLDRVDQSTLRAVGVYSPRERVSLVAQVPLVRKQLSSDVSSDLVGLGDVEIGARWYLVQKTDFAARRTWSFAVSGGTSLPTGGDSATKAGVLLEEHAQLGTGAFGPYAGVLWRLRQDPFTVTASATERLRTENGRGYRYGNAALFGAEVQVEPWQRVAFGLGLDGRYASPDRDHGAAVYATGGLVLAAAPGVYAELGRGLWLKLRAQLPVATRLFGVQRIGPTVGLGLQYAVF